MKKRTYQATCRACNLLRQSGYRVIPLYHDPIFDIEASSDVEIRKIKIIVGTPTEQERKSVGSVKLPSPCKREIWTRNPGDTVFEIIVVGR